MKNAALHKVRAYLSALEALLEKPRDDESLLEFRRICWAAVLIANDSECQKHIDVLVRHAKELYSPGEHPGLEAKIRTVLGAFRERLDRLEAGYGKRWRDLRAA
jgi:hypothetical protein